MFIRNRKIQSLILLACSAAILAQPVVLTAQGPPGPGQKPAFGGQQSAVASMERLSYNNSDIYAFINDMARRIGLTPILVDPTVQGTVDLNIDNIPRDQLFELFNLILKGRNLALVRANGFYQVVPLSMANRNDLEIINDMPAQVEGQAAPDTSPAQPAPKRTGAADASRTIPIASHVIRLDFMAVEDMLDVARHLVSDNASIITFKRQNMMIITDYSDNVARVAQIVRMVDNSFFDADLVELVEIKNSNVLDITDELNKIFASNTSTAAGGASSVTGVSFIPIERLNVIFVTASSKRALNEAKRWIDELDSYDGNKYQIYEYIVQDSTASNIATMLLALYGDGSSSSTSVSSRGTTGTGTTSSTSTSSLLSQALGGDTFSSAAQLGPRLDTSSASVTSIVLSGGGEIGSLRDGARIVVDDTNNVLHIQSTPADYRSLLGTIEKMDVPPRQVFIEAQVLEVDLNNELTYGFRAWLDQRTEGNLTTAGLYGVSESVPGWGSAETFAYVGNSRQIMMAIDALKSKTKVKVLQQPSVLAMDGTQASFLSGAEVPYQSDSYYTGNGTATGISYRETGVNLQVVPRISASGSVTMEIVQEVSSVSERTIAGISAPIFPSTRVTTQFQVKDGETAAIAGLITNTNTWGRAGIPFLSDIPWIGALFGGTTNSNLRTELIILITPHVIRSQDGLQEFRQVLTDAMRNVRKFVDETNDNRVRDIEDARMDREKKELQNIREIKPDK